MPLKYYVLGNIMENGALIVKYSFRVMSKLEQMLLFP